MEGYRDVLISYDGSSSFVYVYDETGNHVIGCAIIDAIDYEILFGLHDVIVSRCRVSPAVVDRLREIAERREE